MKHARIAVLCVICLAQPAFAWGPGGHMMVAFIAYQRLNKNAKDQVDKLIAIQIAPADITAKSLDFVNASHWPDDLRDVKTDEFKATFPLHFIDNPFTNDKTTLPADLPEAENVVTALAKYVDILRTGTDPDARAQALRFVIHFVGDVQQPLHCTTLVTAPNPEGDHGGNGFLIKLPKPGGGSTQEKLHSYWDGGIGKFPKTGPNFAPPPLSEIPPIADTVMTEFPDTAAGWKAGGSENFAGWAKESFAFGDTLVYKGLKPKQAPSAKYNQAAVKVTHQQVAWGGYRLAALLNTIWP